MREILFRGKQIDNGEWVEGYYGSHSGIEAFIIDRPYISVNETFEAMSFYEVDPAAAGQYTGLTDKNGKRIFEGDVVRHHDENPYAIPAIVEKGEVYWDEQFLGWRRTSNGVFHHGVVDTYRMSNHCVYEIIGNIHDNPERLKEEPT